MLRTYLMLVALFSCLLFTGCSNRRADVVEVSGTVTRKGSPVPSVTVNFVPEEGRPSIGTTDSTGHFKLLYSANQDGARTGKHKVFITLESAAGPEAELAMMKGQAPKLPPDAKAIRDKYGDPKTSPLEFEITESGQQIEIKLD